MVTLERPTRGAGFESGIGDQIDAIGNSEDFDIIEQTFAFAEQADLEVVDGAALIALAVIEHIRRLDAGPRGLAGFVAIGPIRRQTMIGKGVDQFEAAAAFVGPGAPAASA